MSTIGQIVTITKSKKATDAKNNLENFVNKINKHLQEYFDKELNNTSQQKASKQQINIRKHIFKHIKEHNLRPAKRLRSSFIYYAYKMLHGKNDKAIINAAMSIELIQTALLIHDDFMDQDEIRRGRATTHKFYEEYHKGNNYKGDPAHYGNSMAINAGDIALCLGYEILGKSQFSSEKKLKALNKLFRGIANTAFGQAYDITLENKAQASEKEILDMYKAKTAVYTYENPLHIGAILAGAKEQDLKILSDYAIPGGIAFQLQDDILGLFGNPEKTGKPAHSDLRQGKMTLLITKALELSNTHQKQKLSLLWGKRNLSDTEAQEARNIVINTGSLEYCKRLSIKWAKKAQEAISSMRNKRWEEEGINYLDGIAQYMIEREM
ncbi:MAG: polyprenyl synthetase family protein [Patescibacteria group bacterium]|nr:polyprenyl synthetase family protein [Patescibacteria group bacterium]